MKPVARPVAVLRCAAAPPMSSQSPQAGQPPGADRRPSIAVVRDLFARFAGHYAGESPLYERLAAGVADDDALLALAQETRHRPIPNIFLAAVQFLLLRGADDALAARYPGLTSAPPPAGDPFPAFRAFCLAHAGALRPLLATRICQTSEVRRCALLLPAFGLVAAQADGRPLAAIEIGASAGFNLRWDRYAYDYGAAGRCGDPGAGVRITCEARGSIPPPVPAALPPVAYRRGVDLHPIDVRDPDEAAWLRALIWPDGTARAELLARAVEEARRTPVPIEEGDALALLPDVLAAVPDRAARVVYHSFTLNQLRRPARARVDDILRDASRARPLWRVSVEELSGDRPALSLVTYRDGEGSEVVLADCQSHGAWIAWRAPP